MMISSSSDDENAPKKDVSRVFNNVSTLHLFPVQYYGSRIRISENPFDEPAIARHRTNRINNVP
jgi:hypothetical protein